MATKQYIKIGEFSEYLKETLESNQSFKNISVKGELANLTFNKSGHIYFSLKDSTAKIDCAIWKSNSAKILALNISEGMEIIATGSISYYKASGKITFIVVNIEIDGVGALAIEYQKREQELHNRGWTDDLHKKPIPKIPNNIGIVTASTGAAVRDLIENIRRRYKLVNIYLFPTLVQGDEASTDIANKIILANKFKTKLDVLIVGRGGGSYEDLWAFNEWPVLEAIHNSVIPIITGIGHQPDTTLADLIADKCASTPTAAGEFASPDINSIRKSLDNNQIYLAKQLQNKLNISKLIIANILTEHEKLLQTKVANSNNFFQFLINNFAQTIENKFLSLHDFLKITIDKMISAINNKLQNSKSSFEVIIHDLEILNPVKPLEKGFALLKQNDKIIRKIDQVILNAPVTAIINDGQIDMNIIKTMKGIK